MNNSCPAADDDDNDVGASSCACVRRTACETRGGRENNVERRRGHSLDRSRVCSRERVCAVTARSGVRSDRRAKGEGRESDE